MTSARRLVYAISGAVLVLVAMYALYESIGAESKYTRGRELLILVLAIDYEWTPAAFIMSFVGLYFLASALRGDRLFSRRWLVSAIAAVTLAWVLVGGMAIFRGLISPEPLIRKPLPPVVTSPA